MIEVGRIREIKATPLCGNCQKRGGCGIYANGVKVVEANNLIGAKEGDWVKLVFEGKKEFLSSLLLFGVPILFLFLGVIFVMRMPGQERVILSAAGGIFGFIFSFFVLKIINNFLSKRGFFLPKIVGMKEEASVNMEKGGNL